mgnify:CR=1 FL=1
MIKEILTKSFNIPQVYEEFEFIQSEFHSIVLNQNLDGYLLFLEYYDVYTVGRFAKSKDTVDLSPIKSSRGGDITFHGKGQEIIYPIINIKKIGISLRDYIDILHNFLIKFLLSKNILSQRNNKGPGLWVKDNKICFVGIAVKNGVTLHGVSVNIKCDLEKFNCISPCGDPTIKVGNLFSLRDINKESLRKEMAFFFNEELNSYKT